MSAGSARAAAGRFLAAWNHRAPLRRRILRVASEGAETAVGTNESSAQINCGQVRYDGHVQDFRRITMDPEVMGGKPCIRGMRVTVGMIVEALAAGRTIEQLLADFPYLEEDDIREALAFAARLAQGHEARLAS